MATPYDTDLDRNAANFQPLTPLSFLERAPPRSFPITPRSFMASALHLCASFTPARAGSASALAKRGIKRGRHGRR